MDENPFRQADATEALYRFTMGLKTRPMGQQQLALIFHVHRGTMRGILESMPGAERVGDLWRVPLHEMPPEYLQGLRIIPRRVA